MDNFRQPCSLVKYKLNDSELLSARLEKVIKNLIKSSWQPPTLKDCKDGWGEREIELFHHRLRVVRNNDVSIVPYWPLLRIYTQGEAEHDGRISSRKQKDESVADSNLPNGHVMKTFKLTLSESEACAMQSSTSVPVFTLKRIIIYLPFSPRHISATTLLGWVRNKSQMIQHNLLHNIF